MKRQIIIDLDLDSAEPKDGEAICTGKAFMGDGSAHNRIKIFGFETQRTFGLYNDIVSGVHAVCLDCGRNIYVENVVMEDQDE